MISLHSLLTFGAVFTVRNGTTFGVINNASTSVYYHMTMGPPYDDPRVAKTGAIFPGPALTTTLRPGSKEYCNASYWNLPPQANGAFILLTPDSIMACSNPDACTHACCLE